MSKPEKPGATASEHPLDEPRIAPNRRGSVFGLSMEPASFEVERPAKISPPKVLFGSDLIVETLRELEIPFIAMKPHEALGELHDSIVNYLGNTRPQLLSCLDEDAALAIAHGYAKVTGKAMAVALANTGSVEDSSTLSEAFHDQTPVLILHSTKMPQPGYSMSPFFPSKLQPQCAADARFAIAQAIQMAEASPNGPVCVALHKDLQRTALPESQIRRNLQRYRAPVNNGAGRKDVAELAAILREAERPLILIGRASRSVASWGNRVILAELLGAKVHARRQSAAAFPTDHPLFLHEISAQDADEADVVLSLDWPDLAFHAHDMNKVRHPTATIIEISADVTHKTAFGINGKTPTPSDILIEADADSLICDLIDEMHDISSSHQTIKSIETAVRPGSKKRSDGLDRSDISMALVEVSKGKNVSITTVPDDWDTSAWNFRAPLDFLGAGSGSSARSIGSALALLGTGRVAVGILEAGAFLTGATALWTAVHYRIPILLVIISEKSGVGNAKYQMPIAQARARSTENTSIGHRISDPEVDICGVASAFGAIGLRADIGYTGLLTALTTGLEHVAAGGVAIVDLQLSDGRFASHDP